MSDFQFQPLWSDPPKGRGKPNQTRIAIDAFMKLLETVPGRWAEMSSTDPDGYHPPSRAQFIKTNYPNAEIETRATDKKNRRRIWVRVKPITIPDVISENGIRQQEQAREAASKSAD